jgi:hypothetical protein
MDNIKRCDWCIEEYAGPGVRRLNPDENTVLCSMECYYELVEDRIADRKYNREMSTYYGGSN